MPQPPTQSFNHERFLEALDGVWRSTSVQETAAALCRTAVSSAGYDRAEFWCNDVGQTTGALTCLASSGDDVLMAPVPTLSQDAHTADQKNLLHPCPLQQVVYRQKNHPLALLRLFTRPSVTPDCAQHRDSGVAFQLLESSASAVSALLIALRGVEQQVRLQDALRAAEQRYVRVLDSIEDAYYEIDLLGNAVFHNRAFYTMLGYAPGEFSGTNFRGRQTADMSRRAAATLADVLQTGSRREQQDWEYLHKSGAVVFVRGSVDIARDSAGNPVGFWGILRDVTAQREMDYALQESEEKYWNVLDSIGDAYYETTLQGRLQSFNTAFSKMLGYSRQELSGMHYRHFQVDEDADRVFQIFNQVYRTGKAALSFDWVVIAKDGRRIVGEGSVHLIVDKSGTASGFRGILRNVTERRLVESALRESESRFRALTNLSSDWYWEQDAESRFTRIESRSESAGLAPAAMLGKRPWECGFEVDGAENWDDFRQQMAQQAAFRDVILVRRSDHHAATFLSVSGEPVHDIKDVFIGYRGVSREITTQKLAEERIQYLATHDELTGLPNRAMLSHLLAMAFANAQRKRQPFAMLFIDLDRFKFVNDTLGHAAGDALLQNVAARFRTALRGVDVLARLGGDEFVVLVQELDAPTQAGAVAAKLLQTTLEPMILAGQECRVSASIGIAMWPDDGEDEQSLMKNADMAMYFAKEEGKNNFQFFSKRIQPQSLRRLAMETSLRYALERQEFFLHYQPKVDLRTGRITGVEALLRWQNPELGLVSPVEFIPLAEEIGVISAIGQWVLQTACTQNQVWQGLGLPPVTIAVNLSVRQFADPDLLQNLQTLLQQSGLPACYLELEITESTVIQNPERAVTILAALRNHGIRLAMDDFGTGYSSLGQLKNFPLDVLKIDRSFVRDLATSASDKAIVCAIITMGKAFALTVIAEGVETNEQKEFLATHGCDEMQGYLFSKPVSAQAFAALLGMDLAG